MDQVYGVHPVLEALQARPQAVVRLVTSRDLGRGGGPIGKIGDLVRQHGITVERVSRQDIEKRAKGQTHQGFVLELAGGEALPRVDDPLDLVDAARAAGRDPLLLCLDGIQDPHNLGALVRSAHALGADGVIVPKDRAASMTETAVKASAGAAFHCPVVQVTNLARTIENLKENGVWTAAADLSDDAELLDEADLTGPLALVIGAEGAGVRRLVLDRCDRRLTIPMPGAIGSLNASVAGSVLLWEVLRQRRASRSESPR